MFQFLIGKVKIISADGMDVDLSEFQFLIGKVKIYFTYTDTLQEKACFNSS